MVSALTTTLPEVDKPSTRAAPTKKTVTHVMAVDPQTSSPHRTISEVKADGSFTLEVSPGHPYVLVFVDSSQKGTAMIVGIFRDQTLDTLAPTKQGSAELGSVAIDPAAQSAAVGIGYTDLLTQLGLSAEAALTLGAVDDLSLRLTNPDIDGDGQIDGLNGQTFWMDIHVRTDNIRLGGPTGAMAKVSDITNQFIDGTGAKAAYIAFNLASLYAEYPTNFDSQTCVQTGTSGPSLPVEGASVTVTYADSSNADAPSSYSQSNYGDIVQWGPDYTLTQVQMPGSGGKPATLVYGIPGGKALTFPNLVTRTRTQLESVGTIVPFIQLVTEGASATGKLTSIKYKFMKRVSSTEWTPATSEEVDLIVSKQAFALFYLGSNASVGIALPAQPTGEVSWPTSPDGGSSATAEQISTATPDSICSMAISYDDKLGLRIFAGSVDSNSGNPCQ